MVGKQRGRGRSRLVSLRLGCPQAISVRRWSNFGGKGGGRRVLRGNGIDEAADAASQIDRR